MTRQTRWLLVVPMSVLLALSTVALAAHPRSGPPSSGVITKFLVDRENKLVGIEWNCEPGSWKSRMMPGFEKEIYLNRNGVLTRSDFAQLAALVDGCRELIAVVDWVEDGGRWLLAKRIEVTVR